MMPVRVRCKDIYKSNSGFDFTAVYEVCTSYQNILLAMSASINHRNLLYLKAHKFLLSLYDSEQEGEALKHCTEYEQFKRLHL